MTRKPVEQTSDEELLAELQRAAALHRKAIAHFRQVVWRCEIKGKGRGLHAWICRRRARKARTYIAKLEPLLQRLEETHAILKELVH